jgi:multisubunit Na+/H+ antiporter MnhG subunit
MNRQKPFQSKKFIALTVGATFTTLFTLIGLIIIALVPVASSAVVNLMTVSLASINGVIGLYAVGQSAVDWKVNSTHNTSQENKIVEQRKKLILEAKDREMKYDGIDDGIDWDLVDESDIQGDGIDITINK